jgi:hypothetical protein
MPREYSPAWVHVPVPLPHLHLSVVTVSITSSVVEARTELNWCIIIQHDILVIATPDIAVRIDAANPVLMVSHRLKQCLFIGREIH